MNARLSVSDESTRRKDYLSVLITSAIEQKIFEQMNKGQWVIVMYFFSRGLMAFLVDTKPCISNAE